MPNTNWSLARCVRFALAALLAAALLSPLYQARQDRGGRPVAILMLGSNNLKPREANSSDPLGRSLIVDGLFYETSAGRITLPEGLTAGTRVVTTANRYDGETRMPDGRTVRLAVSRQSGAFNITLSATPNNGITRWGLGIEALPDEYYTGLMERVVDGPQQASWAPGITQA